MEKNTRDVALVKSFVALIRKAGAKEDHHIPRDLFEERSRFEIETKNNSMELMGAFRDSDIESEKIIKTKSFIIGDESEWEESRGATCMGNCAYVETAAEGEWIQVMTSIVGLPPVFIMEASEYAILTSDLFLLAKIPFVQICFNIQSLKETAFIGHPVEWKTLFKNIGILPGGSSFKISSKNPMVQKKIWSLPEGKGDLDENEFINRQKDIFLRSICGLDLRNAFLSLTGGLDTRAIMAGLAHGGNRIPAYTMSGINDSLDAKIARRLCEAYRIKHEIVRLDDDFYNGIPKYADMASMLSGGLASIDQAQEVFFYERIAKKYGCRISGNLGNQIGRRGAEKVSMRNVDLKLLNSAIFEEGKGEYAHWYSSVSGEGNALGYEFLIEKEIPFSSIGNYTIGNHFVIQKTPYARRELIEINQERGEMKTKELSTFGMRIRDLKHRFLGENEKGSFQMKLIKEVGGAVANCPINWGWAANGGISARGLVEGTMAFLDALAVSRGLGTTPIYGIMEKLKIAGMHEYKNPRIWKRKCYQEFIFDTLMSRNIIQSGIFSEEKLKEKIDEGYQGGINATKEVTFCLDLALAKKNFRAVIS